MAKNANCTKRKKYNPVFDMPDMIEGLRRKMENKIK